MISLAASTGRRTSRAKASRRARSRPSRGSGGRLPWPVESLFGRGYVRLGARTARLTASVNRPVWADIEPREPPEKRSSCFVLGCPEGWRIAQHVRGDCGRTMSRGCRQTRPRPNRRRWVLPSPLTILPTRASRVHCLLYAPFVDFEAARTLDPFHLSGNSKRSSPIGCSAVSGFSSRRSGPVAALLAVSGLCRAG